MNLDMEVLKQALKEQEEQENEEAKLKQEKIKLQREKIALEKEKLEYKRRQQQQREQTAPKAKKDGAIIASLIISFLSFAIMAIFYIVILSKF